MQTITHKSQVAIIGAGPAGMLLAHLLRRDDISAIVLDRQSQKHIEQRVRAGVLERGTVTLLTSLGIADRLHREALKQKSVSLSMNGELIEIDFPKYITDSAITIYGQTEIMKDLNGAAIDRGIHTHYSALDVTLHNIDNQPSVSWQDSSSHHHLECEFIAGCDGYHGVSRTFLNQHTDEIAEHIYPFGWLGALIDAPPCTKIVHYVASTKGFALASMRSSARSRYYVQCQSSDAKDWPVERFWDELSARLPENLTSRLQRGPILERSFTPLRCSISQRMQLGRLFLAGDAAHILPPTGAKGLNLAAFDASLLAEAMTSYFRKGSDSQLKSYTARALTRTWQAARFSWWLTALMHSAGSYFDAQIWKAEFSRLKHSQTAQKNFVECYVGL